MSLPESWSAWFTRFVKHKARAPRRLSLAGKYAEQLEARRLLSASSSSPPAVTAGWFADYPTAELPSSLRVAGPVAPGTTPAQWIIRLTPAALSQISDSTGADAFFRQAQLPVTLVHGLGMPGLVLAQSDALSTGFVQQTLQVSPYIEHFELDQTANATQTFPQAPPSPPDPFQSELGLHNTASGSVDINAPEAWDITTGKAQAGVADTVIAVIDSGIDYTHPDLQANLWDLTKETHSADIVQALTDDPATKIFATATHGYDFVNQDADPLDDNGHGTNVAGIIAADGENALGITGVMWDAKLLPVKYLNQNNVGTISNAIAAVNYVTLLKNLGVNIRAINASWGFYGDFNQDLYDAIAAAGKSDILFVSAAGNGDSLGFGINLDHQHTPFYPASFDLNNVLGVGAANLDGSLASFSNYGATSIDVLAPGVGILTTEMGGGYATRNGTSFATPFVTGTAGLIATAKPQATAEELREAIISGVTKQPSLVNTVAASGNLDAFGALKAQTFAPTASINSATLTASGTTTPVGDLNTINVTSAATDLALNIKFTANGTNLTASSIDAQSIFIRRVHWQGYFKPMTITNISSATNVPSISATFSYNLADATENNDYEVVLQGSRVRDTNGLAARERVIGKFSVNIADANVVTVNTFADIASTDSSKPQVDAQGTISLRSAIQWANANFGNRVLLLPDGIYPLTIAANGTDTTAMGDLDVTAEVKIIASGQQYTSIDSRVLDRVFDVAATGNLELDYLTATGGEGVDYGGGVNNQGTFKLYRSTVSNSEANFSGGGVANSGTSYVIESTVDSNSTSDKSTPLGGGGVYNTSALNVVRSTVSHNKTAAGFSGIGGGGGLFNDRGGNVTIENSTFSGNIASAGAGGGVYNVGKSNINHATIVYNSSASAGGIYNEPGSNSSFVYQGSFGTVNPAYYKLKAPQAVATDIQGNIYIVDTGHHRIQVFDRQGNFLFTFGSFGRNPEELDTPADIAIATDGNIYVVDTGNDLIKVFNNHGVFQFSFNGILAGEGTLHPYDIYINNDIVYVAYHGDLPVSKIKTFTLNGSNLLSFDPHLPKNATVVKPLEISTFNDKIYILNQILFTVAGTSVFPFVITVYDKLGNYDHDFDADDGFSPTIDYRKMAIDNSGNIYLSNTNLEKIDVFDVNGNYMKSIACNGQRILGIAIDNTGGVFAVDGGNEDLVHISSAGTQDLVVGGFDDNLYPKQLAIDGKSHIYSLDTDDSRVRVYDSTGVLLSVFGFPGNGLGQLNYPEGIAVAPSGGVYVADTFNERIQPFTSSGISQPFFGNGNGQSFGIAVSPNGNIYYSNYLSGVIYVYSSSGSFITSFSGIGKPCGALNPLGMAFDNAGNLLVADAGNDRIVVFASDGTFLSTFGSQGNDLGQFANPSSIDIDLTGNIYVADTDNHRIQIFDSTFGFLDSLGTGDPFEINTGKNGEFYFPSSVVVSGARLYVGDDNNRIQFFQLVSRALRKVEIQNSLIANNFSVTGDMGGNTFDSQGNNVIGAASLALAMGFVSSDIIGSLSQPIDPKIGALSNNGGYTSTHLLFKDSPAIDVAAPTVLTVDQLGTPRSILAAPDAGAIERYNTVISGRIFNDSNDNGEFDLIESGIGGMTVFVDRNLNGLLDQGESFTVTRQDDPLTPLSIETGEYQFIDAPGNYPICVANPGGYAPTNHSFLSSGAPISFSTIADSIASYYGAPAIDNDGTVAFIENTENDRVLYFSYRGHARKILNTTVDANVKLENDIVYNDGYLSLMLGGNNYFLGPDEKLKNIANGTTAIPGGEGVFNNQAFLVPPLSSHGIAEFITEANALSNLNVAGVYAGTNPNDLVSLVDFNTLVPDAPSRFGFTYFFNADIDGNTYAFQAIISDPGNQVDEIGIYIGTLGSIPHRVVNETTQIPNSTELFNVFKKVRVDSIAVSGGDVTFSLDGTAGTVGIYRGNGNVLRTIANSHTPIPGGIGNFVSFNDQFSNEATINGVSTTITWPNSVSADGNNAVFVGSGSSGLQGIYCDINGTLRKIIDNNDSLDGLQPVAFLLGKDALNGNQIVFTTRFSDGSEKVMVATVPYISRQNVSISATQEVDNINYGFTPISGQFSGTVFIDSNFNGQHDSLESGQSNVVVYLDQNNNGLLDAGEQSTKTDTNGDYSFANLGTPTTYLVREQVPTDAAQVFPSKTDDLKWTVVLNPGQDLGGYDFGNIPSSGTGGVGNSGVVSGKVFLATQVGQAGWSVYLDNDQSHPITTAADGSYSFSNLTSGTHTVHLIAQADKVIATPLSNKFTPTQPPASPANTFPNEPGSVVVGDFDGRNGNDLAVISRTGNAVSFLMNNGNGVMQPAQSITLTDKFNTSAIITGDFNHDDKLDVAVGDFATNNGSNFAILFNNGTMTGVPFTSNSAYLSPTVAGATQSFTRDLVAADFNHDGYLDIATAQAGASNTVLVFFQDKTQPGKYFLSQQLTAGSNAYAIVALQLNDDDNLNGVGGDVVTNTGDFPDLAVANFTQGTITLLKNNGSGNFTLQGTPIAVESRADLVNTLPSSLRVADFNQDHIPDLAVGDFGTASVSVFLGGGNFNLTLDTTIVVPTGVLTLATADLDNDGDPDIAVSETRKSTDPSDSGAVILRNLGQGKFSAATSTGVGNLSEAKAYYLAAGQIDTNNTVDLVVVNGFNNSYKVLTNEIQAEGAHVVNLNTGLEKVTGLNFVVQDRFSATPSGIQLLAVSDSGALNNDRMTNLNNSSASTSLHFLISGTVPGAQVTLYADGVKIGFALGSGSSTTIVTTPGLPTASGLSDGSHTLTVSQKEANKDESLIFNGLVLQVDTQPPTTPLAPGLAAAGDDLITSKVSTTVHSTVTVTGPSIAGGEVTLYVNGKPQPSVVTAGSTFSVPLSLATLGTYQVQVALIDVAGNTSGLSPALNVQLVAPLGFAFNTGSPGNADDEGRGVAEDAVGNIYIAGSLGATDNNFDGPGVGSGDLWVASYNSTGVKRWQYSPSNPNADDRAFGVATSQEGTKTYVYVTGMFTGTLPVTPTLKLVSQGGADIFILKLNATDGSVVWAKSLGGQTTSSDKGLGIAIDNSGAILVTGQFAGTLASANIASFPTNVVSQGDIDIYLLKLNSDGSLRSLASWGGAGADTGNAVIADGTNNIYIAGAFSGTVQFDPQHPTNTAAQLKSAGLQDGFLLKLTPSGGFQSVVPFSGSASFLGAAYGLALDQAYGVLHGVYVVGAFAGQNVDFDPDPAKTTFLSSHGGSGDAFVAKFDAVGQLQWAKAAGSTVIDRARSIVVQPDASVVITGAFAGTVDFDPSATVRNVVSQGTDGFLWGLSSSGVYRFVQGLGGTGVDYGRSLARDATGNVVVVGAMGPTLQVGNKKLTSLGKQDIFAVGFTQYAKVGLPGLSRIVPGTTFVEKGAPVFIAPQAVLSDSNSANFSGGYVQVRVIANGTSDDRLSLQSQGNAAGQVNLVGTNVKYGGVIIGTVSGGASTSPLKITFNAQATLPAVQAVLRQLTFNVVGNNPNPNPRIAAYYCVDETGLASDPVFQTIQVTAINDPPVLGGIVGPLAYTLNNTAGLLAVQQATVNDIDNANFAGGTLSVKITGGADNANRLQLGGVFSLSGQNVVRSGVVIGTVNANGGIGKTDLIITLNDQATPSIIQNLLRNLLFKTIGGTTKQARTLVFQLTDGHGGTTPSVTMNVTVL